MFDINVLLIVSGLILVSVSLYAIRKNEEKLHAKQ